MRYCLEAIGAGVDGAVASLRPAPLLTEAVDEAAVEVCITDFPVPCDPGPVLNNLKSRSRFLGFSSDIFSGIGFDW